MREAALGEQYDAAMATLAAANNLVVAASHAMGQAQAEQVKTTAMLRQVAVESYVGGGPESAVNGPTNLKSVDDALVRQEMEQTFASDQTDALDRYRQAQLDASIARARLLAARNADARQAARLAGAREQVRSAQDQLVALERQVKGKIATLVAQVQAEQLAAERRAEAARLARERAAAQAAARAQQARQLAAEQQAAKLQAIKLAEQRAENAAAAANRATRAASFTPEPVPTLTPTTLPVPVPGVSIAAETAVRAAMSRVGDPYVWGAAGPDAFDCSGLVMWAYAQAGVYLPHFSGAQYSDTIPISMADLEPGDLVFPADPGVHVAMYIGNGEIVQAPYTGADVQIVPLSSFFVLASRVG
jgi:cell wall-associated NlpC family hydrolase